MPATAGRVRMPANNRVHSSAALQTHGIWQSAIGYDPYAPNKEDKKDTSHMVSNAEPDAENPYANFQGLLALAKISNSNVDIDRGACKKCGRVGHLKFQCKNYVKVKDTNEEKDPEGMQVPALVALDKLKGRAKNVESSDESEEEDEDSDSSDSDVDSEIERIIAERSGKKISEKRGSSRKKKDSGEDDLDTRSSKKRGRSKKKKRHGKREISDSDDSGERRRKRRREHRRKRETSPDDNDDRKHSRRKSRKEKRRRRSRRSESDSETSEDSGRRRHRHRTRRAKSLSDSDSDSSGLGDSRMGRDVKKSGKSKRRHHEHDE